MDQFIKKCLGIAGVGLVAAVVAGSITSARSQTAPSAEGAGMSGMGGMSGMSGMGGMSGMAGMGGMAGPMGNLMMLAPEYRERVGKVSKETLMEGQHLTKQHTRYSDEMTLRQVMQEILTDLQGVIAGIAMHNGRLASERARSVADHYIPRGGIIPYLRLEDITDEKLSVLSGMNAAVEGGARAIADAVDAGDYETATARLGGVLTACVQCHDIFRGVPGVSPALPAKK